MFRERAHDDDAKVVLGVQYPAGGGEAEGVKLLRALAAHPSTAKHLATKLCRRFVSDDPPAGCVDAVAEAYAASNGDIPTLLRTIAMADSSTNGIRSRRPRYLAAFVRQSSDSPSK